MNAHLGLSFASFVDHLILHSTCDNDNKKKTLLIVFDTTGVSDLQPTPTNARHRSSPLYLHRSRLVNVVHIQQLDVLLALLMKILTDKCPSSEEVTTTRASSDVSRVAIWGLLSTNRHDPKIQVLLSRVFNVSKVFDEVVIGEPQNAKDFQTWDTLAKWCTTISSSTDIDV